MRSSGRVEVAVVGLVLVTVDIAIMYLLVSTKVSLFTIIGFVNKTKK